MAGMASFKDRHARSELIKLCAYVAYLNQKVEVSRRNTMFGNELCRIIIDGRHCNASVEVFEDCNILIELLEFLNKHELLLYNKRLYNI